MIALPEWMHPPRPEGWFAEDLDELPDASRHTELIDGALVLRTAQRSWHGRIVTALVLSLTEQAPAGVEVEREMTIRLDERNRPEPDLLVTTSPYQPDRTWYAPEELLLVVEVFSPESAHRDRTVKLRKYAEAGIQHYWRVEEGASGSEAHVYELDGPTPSYVPTGIHRNTLKLTAPFAIALDLDNLVPAPRG